MTGKDIIGRWKGQAFRMERAMSSSQREGSVLGNGEIGCLKNGCSLPVVRSRLCGVMGTSPEILDKAYNPRLCVWNISLAWL